MKKIILSALLALVAMVAHAQGSKILVTYFSWSNNTKALAEAIQQQTGADIYRIEPLVPYTTNYNELAYTISSQDKETNARPALKDTLATLNDYDIIFVGCPVWWFDAPMIIHSFLECSSYNFAGKTVIPFCTYYTAAYQTLEDIIEATPNSRHLTGLGVRGSSSYSPSTISEWLERIGVASIVSALDTPHADIRTSDVAYAINGLRYEKTDDMPRGIYIIDGMKTLVK